MTPQRLMNAVANNKKSARGDPVSIDATCWAWTAEVQSSTQRLVLLSLADRAGEEHTAWPSIERLAKDTVLDKTVQKLSSNS